MWMRWMGRAIFAARRFANSTVSAIPVGSITYFVAGVAVTEMKSQIDAGRNVIGQSEHYVGECLLHFLLGRAVACGFISAQTREHCR